MGHSWPTPFGALCMNQALHFFKIHIGPAYPCDCLRYVSLHVVLLFSMFSAAYQVDSTAFDALLECIAEGDLDTCEQVPAGDEDGFLVNSEVLPLTCPVPPGTS